MTENEREHYMRTFILILSFVVIGLTKVSLAQENLSYIKTKKTEYAQLTDETHSHDPTWSPDGSRIAYCRQHENGRRRIWVMDKEGKNRRQLTTGEGEFDDWYPRWSPDGTRVAFTSNRKGLGFWTVSIKERELYQIPMEALGAAGTIDWQLMCAWSPDSKTLVYSFGTDGVVDIFTIAITGGERKRLTTHSGNYQYATYGAMGTQISYVTEMNGKDEIWIIPSQGGKASRLDTDGQPASYHSWSPDGRWILYQAEQKLWCVAATGGKPIAVSNDSLRGYTAAWAPDSRGIAFTGAINRPVDLMIVNVDGGKSKVLDKKLYAGSWWKRSRPAWSADGKHIAYVGSDTTITVLNINNSEKRSIIKGVSPTWSPDGERIAFILREEERISLWSVAIDGSDPMRLTVGNNPKWVPAWSPDGEWIAYHMRRDGNWDVWGVPAYGGRPVRLTTHTNPEGFPVWQGKDSAYVIFASSKPAGQNQAWNVWRIAIDGGDAEFFYGDPDLDVMWMDFSPDGKSIAYSEWPSGLSHIFIKTIGSDVTPRLIASGGATAPAFSPDGKVVAYYQDKSGSPNIWFAELSGLLNVDNLP